MDDNDDHRSEQNPDTEQRIAALLTQLRTDATAALDRLRHHRDRAEQLRAEAESEARAYAAEWRAIRARGWFTPAQLRGLGFAAPRSRPRRAKPND